MEFKKTIRGIIPAEIRAVEKGKLLNMNETLIIIMNKKRSFNPETEPSNSFKITTTIIGNIKTPMSPKL